VGVESRIWVCAVALGIFCTEPTYAFEWADLWQRPDQRGQDAFQAGDAERAAEFFEDPRWRGAAQYRASDYAGSAATLTTVEDIASMYNRGNALARSGQLEAAIGAYDAVLAVDSTHEDAIYNKALVEELLEQQQQQQQDQEQQDGQNQQSADNSGSNESEEGEQSSEQQAQAGESDENGEPRDNENEQPSEQSAQNDPDQQPEQSEQEAQEEESEQLSAAAPEDIEQWASEQAADQWLRRVPQDPGGLLRRKFYYQYQRLGLDQDGQFVWPGDESEPW